MRPRASSEIGRNFFEQEKPDDAKSSGFFCGGVGLWSKPSHQRKSGREGRLGKMERLGETQRLMPIGAAVGISWAQGWLIGASGTTALG